MPRPLQIRTESGLGFTEALHQFEHHSDVSAMNKNYPAFIFRDDDAFTVIFPDLPGCLTFGSTADEAFNNAREALEGHLAAMHDEHMPIPEPSALEAIDPEDGNEAGILVTKVLVPAVMPGKTVRTNVTIEEGLLVAIDAVTPNRSAFFTTAARNELSRLRAARKESRRDI
ncbi:MAG: type II toxin-antitoxin system HicB family antitoxin [Caenispirillum bisanense]|nr:type II toxin-antitoxin system HicB family antitoxin [Caenispirillum bisanense]